MMIPSIPNSDVVGWVIAPAGRCVSYIGDQMRLGGTLQRSLVALAGQGVLIQASRQLAMESGAPTAAFDALLRQQASLEPLAKEIIEGDYHEINVSTLVACWSALEVAVEDTLILLIVRWSPSVPTIAANGVDLQRYLTVELTEDSATKAVKALERKVRAAFAAGPALVEMLRIAGISVECQPADLEQLTELNAVRNCILHRGGVCDTRTVAEAPGLGLRIGDTVHIGAERMQVYLKVVSEFAVALIKGTAALFSETVRGRR